MLCVSNRLEKRKQLLMKAIKATVPYECGPTNICELLTTVCEFSMS
jgi:hypothetical protein